MEQIAQGDVDAFHTLYKTVSPHILSFLAANNGHGNVEDLFQETLARFWQMRTRFRSESTVLTFVLGITANVIREHETTRQRSQERTRPLQAFLDGMEQMSLAGFQERDGEDLTELLQKLLATLPPKQRAAVDMVYYQKLTASQAAKVIGCSREVFDNRLCRAKKTLKEKMAFLKASSWTSYANEKHENHPSATQVKSISYKNIKNLSKICDRKCPFFSLII